MYLATPAPVPAPPFPFLLLANFPNKYRLAHASETLSKPLPGMPWPLLYLDDRLALLKGPLLSKAFSNFPSLSVPPLHSFGWAYSCLPTQAPGPATP